MKLVRGCSFVGDLIKEVEVVDVNLTEKEIINLAKKDKGFIRVYPDNSPVYTDDVVKRVIKLLNNELYGKPETKNKVQVDIVSKLVEVRNRKSDKNKKKR